MWQSDWTTLSTRLFVREKERRRGEGPPRVSPQVALPRSRCRQGALPIIADIVPPGVLIARAFAVNMGNGETP